MGQPRFYAALAGADPLQHGSTITNVALPLTAVLTLGATPAQMGLLGKNELAVM